MDLLLTNKVRKCTRQEKGLHDYTVIWKLKQKKCPKNHCQDPLNASNRKSKIVLSKNFYWLT